MGLLQEVRRVWDTALSPVFGEFGSEVLLQDVDLAGTVQDPVYAEAEGSKAFSPPVSVRARVRLGKSRLALDAGEADDADGTVTVRADELAEKGLAMDLGSRVLFGGQRFVVDRKSVV